MPRQLVTCPVCETDQHVRKGLLCNHDGIGAIRCTGSHMKVSDIGASKKEQPKRIKDIVNPIGDWQAHLLEWANARRPDTVMHLRALLAARANDKQMEAAINLLAGMAYAAGRSSVIAELEKTTITEVEKQ